MHCTLMVPPYICYIDMGKLHHQQTKNQCIIVSYSHLTTVKMQSFSDESPIGGGGKFLNDANLSVA